MMYEVKWKGRSFVATMDGKERVVFVGDVERVFEVGELV
jgi:hypothetical protein